MGTLNSKLNFSQYHCILVDRYRIDSDSKDKLQTDNRVPTAQGKQRKWSQKNPCQGKHREYGNFAKTQGILFVQVVNSLILRIQDFVIFAVTFLKSVSLMTLSQISEIIKGRISSWTGKTQGICE